MSLKQILVIAVLALIVGGGGMAAAVKFKNVPKQSEVTPEIAVSPTLEPTKIPTNYLTWNDEAGFSFQYPEGLAIDKHPEDSVNYANLTITGKTAGSINILMADDTFKTIDKWAKAGSIDTTLGSKAGKKMIDTSGETIIGVIDNGVLVTIKREANLSPILETAWEKIIDSFEFVYPTPTTASKKAVKVTDNQDSGGDVLEEEN